MSKEKVFPAKLLLFGEYSILHSGIGLAIPLDDFHGKWMNQRLESKMTDTVDPEMIQFQKQSKASLQQMIPYLSKMGMKDFSIEQYKKDVDQRNYYWSNIKQGYGLGSSASLSAAIYDRYVESKPKNLLEVQIQLAQIESFFHGKSSGIDPLVSYISKAIYIDNGTIKTVEESSLKEHFFLIDTKQARRTKGLVQQYLYKYKSDDQFHQKMDKLAMLNQQAIKLYLAEDVSLFETIKNISLLQFNNLKEMIPEDFRPIWKESLDSDHNAIKLNGAGGGGYMQGYSR